jgi:hypothetical protein
VQVLGGYAAAGLVLATTAAMRSPAVGAFGVPEAWVLLNGPGTILLVTFLWRPIRAVGPMVLAFLLVATIGTQAILWLASASDAVLRLAVRAGLALGLDAQGVFWALQLAGMLVFAAAAGWPLLQWIGRRYQARRFSDQMITIDSLFLVFAVVQSLPLAASNGVAWLLAGVVAFAGCKAVATVAFRITGRPTASPRTLLLLRVFRLGRREEHLFDRLRRHWQPLGGIRMIAGLDLVTSLVEPHQFLDFLPGRLDRRFVSGAADLAARIDALDNTADPDGRYRISEFFCRADNWQLTMRALASVTGAVLMDLRSFSSRNMGCVYEIGCLVNEVDLDRVLFLVDDTTDQGALRGTLERLWKELPAVSPNRRAPAPAVRLFHIDRQSEAELVALAGELLGAQRYGVGNN